MDTDRDELLTREIKCLASGLVSISGYSQRFILNHEWTRIHTNPSRFSGPEKDRARPYVVIAKFVNLSAPRTNGQ